LGMQSGPSLHSVALLFVAYSAAISALSKGKIWLKALELFRELESSGNTPRYGCAGIFTCRIERSARPQPLLCNRSIVTYNATMTALEKGLQWERALDLFDEMKMKGLAVTVRINSMHDEHAVVFQ
jgi:pentatricopeptide repeat domain-containing protein 1